MSKDIVGFFKIRFLIDVNKENIGKENENKKIRNESNLKHKWKLKIRKIINQQCIVIR